MPRTPEAADRIARSAIVWTDELLGCESDSPVTNDTPFLGSDVRVAISEENEQSPRQFSFSVPRCMCRDCRCHSLPYGSYLTFEHLVEGAASVHFRLRPKTGYRLDSACHSGAVEDSHIGSYPCLIKSGGSEGLRGG